MRERVGTLAHDVTELPHKTREFARGQFDKAEDAYEQLAGRGQRVVGRIRRQEPARELAEQAKRTGRRGNTATRAARATQSKRTAEAAAKAAESATEEIGR